MVGLFLPAGDPENRPPGWDSLPFSMRVSLRGGQCGQSSICLRCIRGGLPAQFARGITLWATALQPSASRLCCRDILKSVHLSSQPASGSERSVCREDLPERANHLSLATASAESSQRLLPVYFNQRISLCVLSTGIRAWSNPGGSLCSCERSERI